MDQVVIDELRQTLELTLPWPTYALGWSNVAPNPRLFVGSYLVSPHNSLHGIDLHNSETVSSGDLSYRPSCTSPTDGLPVSQIVCQPLKHGLVDGCEELVAAASDSVRLWRASLPEPDNQLAAIQAAEKGLIAPPPGMVLVAELANRRQSHRAPLTGLDWSTADSRLLITSSIDTTCTVWDLEASKVKTQLIAHDRSVLDVQFASVQSSDVFGSAGEDGSVRLFDLRSLDQSTILFESGGSSGKEGSASPLLRLRFNRSDSNYLAVLELGALPAVVLDIRMPGVQVAKLCGHTSPPTSLSWHPLSRNHLVTGSDDGFTHLWDLNKAAPEKASGFQFAATPEMSFDSNGPVHNLTWSMDGSNNCFLAIGSGEKVKIIAG